MLVSYGDKLDDSLKWWNVQLGTDVIAGHEIRVSAGQ